jgi:YggT family protein
MVAGLRPEEGQRVDLILQILLTFLRIMTFLIIGRALVSWFDPRGNTPVARFLYEVTEPIIAPIRSIMPRTGFIDLSPMIAILLIILLQTMLANAIN